MSSLLDDGVQSRMQRLFLRKGTPYSAVPNEDSAAQRDSDRQVLDANEAKDVNAQQSEAPSEPQSAAAEAGAETAEVLATATLLGANGVASDSHQATNAPKAFKKPSKGLLGCLHFSKKEKEEKPIDGLPYAFNNRQSIFKRLARSAKMSAPVTVVERTPKPVKKSPFALHAAAWRANTNELLEQLATGADVARRDKAGLTALHYAAWQGSVDAVQLLLEKGINVNAADPEGMLPIHFAAWFNRLDVAALLLDKGSMINPPTKGLMWPTTPLIYASKMGHRDMTALLMERGAQVAATYKAASSALHEAAWGGHAEVVAEMMARGVPHDLSCAKSKYRALHLAAMSGSAAVADVLLAQALGWMPAHR
ncbi:ankyrin repeat-containing domain protein [Scenedesmus sp. NREL 46B-D3]|nr:ankyrin repeat-containing domain protein [Scenedesmus sp. NREL 46B-D3]